MIQLASAHLKENENKSIKTEPIFELENLSPECLNKINPKPNDKMFLVIPLENSLCKSEKSSIANCLICCDKPPNAVFMDCGHGGNFGFL